MFEMAGPVLPDGCDVAESFGLAVAAAALSVCVDVAASLLPTVAAAANSALPTLRRHNVSAAAEQTKYARGRRKLLSTFAVDNIILFIAQLLSRAVCGIFCLLSTETEKWSMSLHAAPQGVTTKCCDSAADVSVVVEGRVG